MSMREDLDAPATKNDIVQLDQRIDTVHRSLAIEIVKTTERIDRLGESLREEIRASSSHIISVVDGFMAQVGKVDRAQAVADWRLTQLDQRVTALETR